MTARPGGIGDCKPSNLLMKIRTLSSASYEAMECAMFLSQLPPVVRTALANSRAANNYELGVEADNVMEEFQLGSDAFATPHAIAAVERPLEVDAASMPRNRRPAAEHPRSRRASEVPPQPVRPVLRTQALRQTSVQLYRSSNCPMRDQVVSPPPSSGNARAGR